MSWQDKVLRYDSAGSAVVSGKLVGGEGATLWKAALGVQEIAGKGEERDKLLTALGLVNAEIDFGEPIDQGVSLAA